MDVICNKILNLHTNKYLAVIIALTFIMFLSSCSLATPAPTSRNVAYTFASGENDGIKGIHGKDGSISWQDNFGWANWDPIIVGDVMYSCSKRDVYAIRLSDGEKLWSYSPASCYVISADSSTLLIYTGDMETNPSDQQNELIALNATNGEKLWQKNVNQDGLEARAEVAGDIVYYLEPIPSDPDNANLLHVLNSQTGNELWNTRVSYKNQEPTDFSLHGGIFANSYAVFATDISGLIEALDKKDGHLLWESSIIGRVTTASEQMVIVNAGTLTAMDGQTGQQLWTNGAVDDYMTSVITGRYVVNTLSETVIVQKMDDGSVVWQKQAPDNYGFMPSYVVDNTVFAYTEHSNSLFCFPIFSSCGDHLLALDISNGNLYWDTELNDGSQFPSFD